MGREGIRRLAVSVATTAIVSGVLVAGLGGASAYASRLGAHRSLELRARIIHGEKKTAKRTSASLRVSHTGARFSVSLKAPGQSGCVISVSAANEQYTFPSIRLRRKGDAILKWRSGKNAPAGQWTVAAACRASGKVLRATSRVTIKKARSARRVLAHAASLPSNGALVVSASVQVQGAIVEGSTTVNLTAPAGASTEQTAVNWALHEMQTDPSGYNYLCLPFVQAAYSAAGFSITAHTSGVTWNSNAYPDDVWGHTVGGTTGAAGTTPPVGALVFYSANPTGDDGGDEPSHVEIYVGNGWNIATADYYDDDTTLIHYEPYGAHPRELGWWLPDRVVSAGGGGNTPTTTTTTAASPTGSGTQGLIMFNPSNSSYAVALSTGSSFGAAGTGTWLTGWGNASDALVGDFTGDGKDDLLVPNSSNGTWAVAVSTGTSLEGPGTGTWLTGWTTTPAWDGVGDFTGDGKDDLVVCNNNQYDVAVSNGTQLNAAGSGDWLNGWGCNSQALVGDFTGNGLDDLLVPNASNNTWAVALSTGASFGAPGTGTWLTGWTATPTWAAVGDFTGMGRTTWWCATTINTTWPSRTAHNSTPQAPEIGSMDGAVAQTQ